MSRQILHPDEELDERIRHATEEVLLELGFTHIAFDGIRRDQGSAKRFVDLA